MDELEKIMVNALKEVRKKEPSFSFNGVTLKESEILETLENHSSVNGSCYDCAFFGVANCTKTLCGLCLQLIYFTERKNHYDNIKSKPI